MNTELDFQASNHGTIYLLQPLSERAAAHLTRSGCRTTPSGSERRSPLNTVT